MPDAFDPYHKWLGIPVEERPADHYRLLGVPRFETDPDVIANAADQRMAHVRTFQTGQHAALSQGVLNELATARVCLLNAKKKAEYDAQLRAADAARAPQQPAEPNVLADLGDLKVSVTPRHPVWKSGSWWLPACVGVVAILGPAMWLISGHKPTEEPARVAPRPQVDRPLAPAQPLAPAKLAPARDDPKAASAAMAVSPAQGASPRSDTQKPGLEDRGTRKAPVPEPQVKAPGPVERAKPNERADARVVQPSSPQPIAKPVPEIAEPRIDWRTVCECLQARKSPVGLLREATTFSLPPSNGRKGGNGFFIPAPRDWAKMGTAFHARFARTGSARGIVFIHPLREGHVVVAISKGQLLIGSPGRGPHAGFSRMPKPEIKEGPDFPPLATLDNETPHDLISLVLPNGRFVLYVNGKLAAGGIVKNVVPLELTDEFQGSGLPPRLAPGMAGVMIGATDKHLNRAEDIRLGTPR